jgi:predicted AlkP superfamily phosphohydrolase/phosphomutase
MRHIFPYLLILLLATIVSGQPQAESRGGRVVLITISGASDAMVDDLLARGVLPPDGGLARLARTGVRAERLIPVAAPETPVSFASLQTGAYPERHGIVEFFFHEAGTPITETASPFNFAYQAETLVEAALRQGKNVVQLFSWPPREEKPGSGTLYSLTTPQPVSRSVIVELKLAAEVTSVVTGKGFEHIRPLQAKGDSPPAAFRFFDGGEVKVGVFAGDSVVDGREKYDRLLLDFDNDPANGWAAVVRYDDWAVLTLPSETGLVTAHVRALSAVEDLSHVSLYLGMGIPTAGGPAAFVEAVKLEHGPVPGGSDRAVMELGILGEQIWWEQKDRSSDYTRDVALRALRNNDFDLLVVSFSVDGAGHFFHLRHPRQISYHDEEGEKRIRFAQYLERAFQDTDRYIRELMDAAPPGTNFVVVSDHGMASQHTLIRMDTLLEQAGFHITDDASTELITFANGNSGNVYLNLAGREPQGVVSAELQEGYINRIIAACKTLSDPVTGESVFDVVLTRSEMADYHQAHPRNSGDVWVVAKPGYVISQGGEASASVLTPYDGFPGLHGHLGSHPEMQGAFFSAGPGIRKGWLGPVRVIDVAPTVTGLLGIEPPAQSQGRNIFPESQ